MQDLTTANQMLKMISIVQRKTQMYLNGRAEPYGLTGAQAPLVMIACEEETVGQNRLCELLEMDKSTVAKLLARLETQGYVTRVVNAEDGRSFDIHPTDRAREIAPALRQAGEDWVAELTSGMTEIERLIFFQLIKQVSTNAAHWFSGLRDAKPA